MAKIPAEERGGGHRWENLSPDPVFSVLNIHVLCAYRMELGKEWVRGFIRTHYDRIYYVHSGAALLEFDGDILHLKPGYLYLVPANVRHRHSCEDRISLSWCHFRAEAEGGIDLFELLSVPRELMAEDDPVVRDFSGLVEGMAVTAGWGMLLREKFLLGLLMPFLRVADERALRENRDRYLPVLRFVDSHLAGSITLDDLAGRMNLSTEHFCRIFSRDFHIPPMRYVMRKRVQLAQHLLCQTDLRHHEIARRCGFGDPFYFSKSFKRISGMSPSDYRNHYYQ